MKRMFNMVTLTAVLAFALGGETRAAGIGFVGSVEGGEVSQWLTTTTPKSFDIDGDNRYGSTLGAVHWTVVGYRQQPAGSPTLGWAYLGESSFGQFRNPDYPLIDNLADPAADIQAGIAAVQFPGVVQFELTGQPSDYAGKRVRLGVMADVLGPTEWAVDFGKRYQIRQIVGGSGDSGPIDLRGGEAADGNPEMYFFDLTGVNPGDRFEIIAHQGPSLPGYIGPVSWDIGPAIPEPSSVVLALAGCAGLWFVRRR